MITVAIVLHGYDQFRVLSSIDIDGTTSPGGSSGSSTSTSSSNSWNEIVKKHQLANPTFNFTKLIDITCNNPSVNMVTVASKKEQISKVTGKSPRILCIVLTHSEAHTTHIPIIQQTWGKKCTKLLFASDKEGNTEDIVDEHLRHMNRDTGDGDDPTAGDPSVVGGGSDDEAKHNASNDNDNEENRHNRNGRNNKHSEIIHIKSDVGYWGIWDKLLQTLLYVHTHYRIGHDYDWILKADDDTYFVMENLKAFLAKQIDLREELQQAKQQGEQQQSMTINNTHNTVIGGSSREFRSRIIQNEQNIQYFRTSFTNYTTPTDNDITTINNRKLYGSLDIYNEPIVFARTMPFPKYKDLYIWKNWLSDKKNYWFGRKFNKTGIDTEHGTVIYPHGGPGYIMNWMYVDMLVDSFVGRDPKSRVRGRVSEDIANAITMLYRGVTPYSTRDPSTNLERSHPEPPEIMYDNPKSLKNAQVNIENTGYGVKCCSPSSISYHHVRPEHMKLIDYQLYECPKIMN